MHVSMLHISKGLLLEAGSRSIRRRCSVLPRPLPPHLRPHLPTRPVLPRPPKPLEVPQACVA